MQKGFKYAIFFLSFLNKKPEISPGLFSFGLIKEIIDWFNLLFVLFRKPLIIHLELQQELFHMHHIPC